MYAGLPCFETRQRVNNEFVMDKTYHYVLRVGLGYPAIITIQPTATGRDERRVCVR